LKNIITFLLNGLSVLLAAYLLPGVHVHHYGYALLAALVMGLINMFIKPLLIILTIPVTILTFGLFLLVINALLVQLAGWLVPGFEVGNFWWALLFSLVVSLFNSMFADLLNRTAG
jgi:putative membrane protein